MDTPNTHMPAETSTTHEVTFTNLIFVLSVYRPAKTDGYKLNQV